MTITKIDGLESWGLPPGGQSREAKERALFEKEKGLDVNLNESSGGKALREARGVLVLKALGIAASAIEELKKKAAAESELSESDLNPLSGEIRKLKRDLKRMAVRADLEKLSTNPKATVGLKYVLSEKKGLRDLPGTLSLIEKFQCGELSAEKLLTELETRGIFDFK